MIKFYGYKKCSTCRKAETFLEKNKVGYDFIDITENPPSKAQLKKILKNSGQLIKKLFNTSGQVYREMGLKDKVDTLGESEIFSMMADNGKLIKRPLAFDGEKATIGFREEDYKQIWKRRRD
ncbi:MAG: arsenate reductase family protein [Oligoflexales bacterium]